MSEEELEEIGAERHHSPSFVVEVRVPELLAEVRRLQTAWRKQARRARRQRDRLRNANGVLVRTGVLLADLAADIRRDHPAWARDIDEHLAKHWPIPEAP